MANVTAKTSHTVQMKDGGHRVVNRGDVFDVDDTSSAYQDSLETDYGKDLVSTGGEKPDDDMVSAPEGLVKDAGEVTKERLAEKDDVVEPLAIPPRMDPGRTLPESGVDQAADEKFAEGDANTGADVPLDMGVQRENAAKAAAEAAEKAKESKGLPKRQAAAGRKGGESAPKEKAE